MMVPTLNSSLSPAEICRRNGWTAGTRLAGDEGMGIAVIEITAVGRENVLAIEIISEGKPVAHPTESDWDLDCREWKPWNAGGYPHLPAGLPKLLQRCANWADVVTRWQISDTTADKVARLRDDCKSMLATINAPAVPPSDRHGIYFASKVIHAPKWQALRAAGVPTASTWIDEAGEGQSADYAELSARCLREIAGAERLVLYCEPGEILKGALIEAGAALAAGTPVHLVGNCPSLSRVFREHPLWREFDTIESAIEEAKESQE